MPTLIRCARCVMDATVADITFDQRGECKFCKIHDELDAVYPIGTEVAQQNLELLIRKVKLAGQGKRYDVVCGVSGGRDSMWTLYKTVKLGLRPLAVHFDNGWNSEVAVTNIYNGLRALDVDLETVVADWEEFRDLQLAFLRASVPEVEIPTDIAIHKVLHEVAASEGIRYIFNGHSFRTEGVSPRSWTYMDGRYLAGIQRRFGRLAPRDFRNFTISDLLNYSFLKGIKVVPILNYFVYDHVEVQEILEREMGWRYYGGHHYESFYTRLIQSYLLPLKFNIDKRKTELSALIRSGFRTRQQSIEEIAQPLEKPSPDLIDYTLSKLGITRQEWEEILALPPKSFLDYPSYYPYMKALRWPIKLACELNLLPKLLYLKCLG